MVNYRRLVCEVVLLGAFLATAFAAPTPDCKHTLYDQRQNGTENYRLNIDGVVFAVAPVDSLFSALGDLDDISELLALEDFNPDFKPKPPQSSTLPAIEIVQVDDKPKPEEKPSEEKPSEEKPSEQKPSEEKPLELKSALPVKAVEVTPLSDVNVADDEKIQKKEVSQKKQDKTKRLKNRLAAFLLPLLRKTRHH